MVEVYHLKRWALIRDYFSFAPDGASDTILDIGRDIGVDLKPSAVRDMVESCSKAITKEGLEACMVSYRTLISDEFKGIETHPKFEQLLRRLDEIAERIWIEDLYEKHRG